MFRNQLSSPGMMEKKDSFGSDSTEVIHIKDCSVKAFRIMIDYIYLDNLHILDEINGCNELTEILKLAKQYQLPDLLDKCERQFLTLSSLQLFRNLITSSFGSNTSLKRNKDKKAIGNRSYQPEASLGEPFMSNTNALESSERAAIHQESVELDVPFRRQGHSKKHSKGKNENLEGVMFLADGRVLIVNNDLYQEVMKKAIVIDLKDKGEPKTISNSSSSEEESKEYVHSHSKAENPRSVTQSKKVKKSIVNPGNSQLQNRRTTAGEESAAEIISNKSEFAPLKREVLMMLDNREFSDIILSIDGREIYAHRTVL